MAIKPETIAATAAGLVILAGGLIVTAGLASFLHWRAETRQEVAMAAQARQTVAWETPPTQGPTQGVEQVLFIPKPMASSGP
jgi:hypothetical protein